MPLLSLWVKVSMWGLVLINRSGAPERVPPEGKAWLTVPHDASQSQDHPFLGEWGEK